MKMFKFLLVAILSFTVVSCNQDKVDQLTKENQELKETSTKKDASMEKMLSSFNEIQSNLKEIKKREGMIEVNTSANGEIKQDISSNIKSDIKQISSLMQRNEELIKELNTQLEGSQIKMGEFRTLIANLNNRVKAKNNEIAELNEELKQKKIKIGQLYFSVDSLAYANRLKEAELDKKIEKLNEGFYALGTFSELKEKNVLTKEGGFLGLGKEEELKDNFNKEYFSRIDKTKQTSFLIYSKKAELISKHPESSYEFKGKEGTIDSLVVTDVEEFWRASNYLVIVVD